MAYESKEELWFSWYLNELTSAGFIDRCHYHPKPFELSEKVMYQYIKQLKTKVKHINRTLLKPHTYQADFVIIWNPKAYDIFFTESIGVDPMKYPFYATPRYSLGQFRSVVDIKGTFNRNESWTKFSVSQKWVWQKYRLYVQKIVLPDIFKKTFTPDRFRYTDAKKQKRTINYKPIRTLDEYLSFTQTNLNQS